MIILKTMRRTFCRRRETSSSSSTLSTATSSTSTSSSSTTNNRDSIRRDELVSTHPLPVSEPSIGSQGDSLAQQNVVRQDSSHSVPELLHQDTTNPNFFPYPNVGSNMTDKGSIDIDYSTSHCVCEDHEIIRNYVPHPLPSSLKHSSSDHKHHDPYSLLQAQKDFESLVWASRQMMNHLRQIKLTSSQLSNLLSKQEQYLQNNCANHGDDEEFSNLHVVDYNDGSKYKGELDHNRVRHGKGSYYYPSGTVYRGEWENGGRHGLGVCDFVSQNRYIGYWVQGRREGLGAFMFTKERAKIHEKFNVETISTADPGDSSVYLNSASNNTNINRHQLKKNPCQVVNIASNLFDYLLIDKNSFRDGTSNCDELDKSLSHLFEDRERYEGMFYHDQRHGFGIYYFPDGSCYAGGWRNNRRQGKGIYLFTSGRIYVGDWVNSQREGHGIMKDSNGQILYKGEWVADRKEGKGIQHDSGDWITAIWKANKIDRIISVELFPVKQKLKDILFQSNQKNFRNMYFYSTPPSPVNENVTPLNSCYNGFKDIRILLQ